MKKEMDKVSRMWRHCFFCGKAIDGKINPEHIIPNALLGKLGIKEETLSGNHTTQYSRIKVPAYSNCNWTFGSRYEDKIQRLLNNPEDLYSDLIKEQDATPIQYTPNNETISIITTWLSKVYYGLFYNDFLKTDSEEYRNVCGAIIESENFRLVRQSYANGSGFTLPSSLYVFRTEDSRFDLMTMVDPPTILLKVKKLTLILCVCDGYLTKNYLNSSNLGTLEEILSNQRKLNENFPSHKYALAEILALRLSTPKSPSFVFNKNQVLNMSFITGVKDPSEYYQVDDNEVDQHRTEILRQFGFRIN